MTHHECRACARFPADRSAPGRARRTVDQVLREARAPGARVLPLVRLLTSELVTNAVRHGRSELDVQHVELGPDRVCVAAEDASPEHPRVRAGHALGGRGMALIDEHASAWGVAPTARGKVVWFQTAFDARLPPPLDPRRC
jgi:anti-sigma regulatory factor (Ser/Thr protein kinase)